MSGAWRFAHRLALALGGMTVAEMMQRMSNKEFNRWMVFYELEPWGIHDRDERSLNLYNLMIALFWSAFSGGKGSPKKIKRSEMFIRPEPEDLMREPPSEIKQKKQMKLMQKIKFVFGDKK
jgi:hypothetical protein